MVEAVGLGWLFGMVFFFVGLFNVRVYITILSVLAIFALLNYFIRINIKEFLKSYFLTFFIIFLITIIMGFYITYGVDNVGRFLIINSPKVKKFLPDEYRAYIYINFLFDWICYLTLYAPLIILCLLQAYFFKCYSTGIKRKKISWLIGFACSSPFFLY
ncbi:hypothetical protein [Campylobacter taeniopygiae]|uniref:Uncharacterized protein n=1 Tax=Campylobacter taeniopygiae TaxID=2510188 RepID=A0ABY2TGK7_9BACT|nr:hypothetical protein [Campylobacter taeniopygiae]TKX33254.1 hypothetical protein CQA75_08490 [Campylobacter taeniopygiae]